MSSSTRRKEKGRGGDRSRRTERDRSYHNDSYRDRTPRAYDREVDAYPAPEEEFANLSVSEGDPTTSSRRDNGNEGGGTAESTWGEWSSYAWTDQYGGCWYSSRMNSLGEYEYRYDSTQSQPAPEGSSSSTTSDNYAIYSTAGISSSRGSFYESQPADSISTSKDAPYSSYPANMQSASINTSQLTPASTMAYGPYLTHSENRYSSSTGQSSTFNSSKGGLGYNASGHITSVYATHTTGSGSHLPPISVDPPFHGCACEIKDGLCGVLLVPKPKGSAGSGKAEREKKNSSKHQKSKKSEQHSSSRHSNRPDRLHIKGPNGDNCGPLTLPGVTPSPMPKLPENATPEQQQRYEREYDEWYRGYQEWKHITCPCGLGYFNTDGVWISGADVRSGREPPNPLWTNGTADTRDRERGFGGELFERDP